MAGALLVHLWGAWYCRWKVWLSRQQWQCPPPYLLWKKASPPPLGLVNWKAFSSLRRRRVKRSRRYVVPELWVWNPRSSHLVLECGRWGGSSLAPGLVCALPNRMTVLHRNGLSPTIVFTWLPPLTVSQGLGGRELLSWAEAPLELNTWTHSLSPVVL